MPPLPFRRVGPIKTGGAENARAGNAGLNVGWKMHDLNMRDQIL